MLKIIVSLLIGFVIGYRVVLSDKQIQLNGKLQTIWLLLLIFSMGMSIGMNRSILQKLPVLGWKALLFAVLNVVGSVAVVYVVSRLFFEKEGKN